MLQIMKEIQDRRDWIGVDWVPDSSDEEEAAESSSKTTEKKTIRLLDYACGTGLVSRVCHPSLRLVPGRQVLTRRSKSNRVSNIGSSTVCNTMRRLGHIREHGTGLQHQC